MTLVDRRRTALRRHDLSRPVKLAIADSVLGREHTFFDYGCGHGDDVRRLAQAGFEAVGWDPVHRPEGKRPADVVNLGYVVNVIENAAERIAVLRDAWHLAREALVVSARLETDRRELAGAPLSDGLVTRLGTFQKFFAQDELRAWIDEALGQESVAAAPGVFYVFRDRARREAFAAARFRSRISSPRPRKSDALYEEHQAILDALAAFVEERGRLPEVDEFEPSRSLVDTFGSIRRAFALLRRVTGAERWDEVRNVRSADLMVYLGLARFGGRPRFGQLPRPLQRDIKALFSSYKASCAAADELLFQVGNGEEIDQACRKSSVGKLTGNALYVHRSVLPLLSPLLRVYEGCARAYLGLVEEANIIKLARGRPKVSYLAYPEFDNDPHPALDSSTSVQLDTFRVRTRQYKDSENPPILHRKEQCVADDYPARQKFERLTRHEERLGLYDDTSLIGLRAAWDELLAEKGLVLRGHRVVRARRAAG